MKNRTILIFVIPTAILLLLAGLFSALPTQAVTSPPPDDIVPINGLAHWGVDFTGQGDFDAVHKVPFQAANPTRAVWDETQLHNASFLTPTLENIQVSVSGVVSGASNLVNDFSEVMVSIDPTDPNHLLGASKFFYIPASYLFYTGVFESFDAGLTWSQVQPNGIENYTLTSDPVTTFDDQGNAYFTLLTRNTGGYTGLDMMKKLVGSSWEAPVVVDSTTFTDKQWIIGDQDPQGISPHAGNVYMSWTNVGSGIVFARSTDSNQTWSSPLFISSGAVQGSIPGVAPDGSVYVVYGRNIFSAGSGSLEIRKSTNGGVSFGSTVIAANISPIPFYLPNNFGSFPNFRTPASLPAFAISPVDGNLYLAWADYRNGDADIYFTRSTDGGATWQLPHVRLNDDPVNNGMDQFQPQISVAPNGRVAVMWFDRRLDCPDLPWIPINHVGVSNACIDTFMTRSFDEGQTWVPNLRVSEQTWDWTLNLPVTGGGDGFIGDYQGIASNNDFDFPFWNATANLGENVNNYQEVFVVRVPVTLPVAVDLSSSFKVVTPTVALPGDTLTYTVSLQNAGPGYASVTLTDTLPLSTTFVPESLLFTSGLGGYLSATRTITWTGVVSVGVPVNITFRVLASSDLLDGDVITNTGVLSDGVDMTHFIHASTIIQLPVPDAFFILSTDPPAGATNIGITETVVITFNAPVLTATLVLTTSPGVEHWVVSWNGDRTVVALWHDALAYSETYTLTVAAMNDEGTSLTFGPVPNPWSFTTVGEPPPPPPPGFELYLPVIRRE